MKEKYKRWTISQRAELAAHVAAHNFHTFCDPKFRGPKWTPNDVQHIIASQAKIQCLLGCINPKYHDQVVNMAVDFYDRYLAQAMQGYSSELPDNT